MTETLTRRQLLVLIAALMATGIGQSLVFAILAPLGREVDLAELPNKEGACVWSVQRSFFRRGRRKKVQGRFHKASAYHLNKSSREIR